MWMEAEHAVIGSADADPITAWIHIWQVHISCQRLQYSRAIYS
jgi:hypothetical protein